MQPVPVFRRVNTSSLPYGDVAMMPSCSRVVGQLFYLAVDCFTPTDDSTLTHWPLIRTVKTPMGGRGSLGPASVSYCQIDGQPFDQLGQFHLGRLKHAREAGRLLSQRVDPILRCSQLERVPLDELPLVSLVRQRG